MVNQSTRVINSKVLVCLIKLNWSGSYGTENTICLTFELKLEIINLKL